jgi:hypothetical protein
MIAPLVNSNRGTQDTALNNAIARSTKSFLKGSVAPEAIARLNGLKNLVITGNFPNGLEFKCLKLTTNYLPEQTLTSNTDERIYYPAKP